MKIKTIWRLIRCKLGFYRERHIEFFPNIQVNIYKCTICGEYYDDFYGGC